MNIGPTSTGEIPVIMQERLRDIGGWLFGNGEAVYSTNPWPVCQNDTGNGNIW